jgi:hypothetical protein
MRAKPKQEAAQGQGGLCRYRLLSSRMSCFSDATDRTEPQNQVVVKLSYIFSPLVTKPTTFLPGDQSPIRLLLRVMIGKRMTEILAGAP